MLGVNDFAELDRRSAMSALFRGVEYNRFNAFRELSDSRFIGLVCPRVLLRAPYRGRVLGDCGFAFTETVADEGRDQVWGVGALALAQICIRAFNDYRWLAAVRGTIEDTLAGGVITDLASPDFETDAPGLMPKFPLEVNVTEHLERDLTEAGLICIRRCKDTPYSVINNLPSVNRPKGAFTSEAAKLNEQLSSMLNYMLCVSRFAHYVKVMARDWIGSYISPEDCQRRLNSWLLGYCTTGDDLAYETRARYPLEAARVRVRGIPAQPGSYECQIHLKPHLQLDQAISEFQLITVVQGIQRQL
jgi:type VI secretion system protein ImpD